MEQEVWKTTVESDLYEVSNWGNVRHVERKKNLVTDKKHASGYLFWTRKLNNKNLNSYVHRTVYQAFVGSIPEKGQIDHLDFNPHNCRLDNLILSTPGSNLQRSRDAGRFKNANLKHSKIMKEKWANGFKIELSEEARKSIGAHTRERIKLNGHPLKGRTGFKNPLFNFTSELLIQIREDRANGFTYAKLCEKYNRSHSSIWNVCHGKYKHLI